MKRGLAIVTGATSGLGLETAKGLAAQGWDLALACRDDRKAKAVADQILSAYQSIMAETLHLDLASLQSIRGFADELSRRHQRIDLLVNNAGVYCDTRSLTAEGFEMTIGVNFLGTVALTRHVVPLMTDHGGSGARIVNVASAAAAYGRLRPGDGMFVEARHGFRGYAASKLALVLFTHDLALELAGTGVTVNAVHPGDAATNIWRGQSLLMKAVGPLMKRWLRSPAEAAQAIIRAATAPELAQVTGRFLDGAGEVAASPKYDDETLRMDVMRRASAAIGSG